MSLLDHPVITNRYFFPRSQPPRERHVVEVEDASLACAHYDHGSERTLVHFHGNGEVVADWEDVFPAIARRADMNLLLAEYRGYGGSTGRPQLGRMLEDVDAIVEAAGGDASRMVAFGRSVGSIFAIELVHRHPDAAGLVLESGIADVLQRILLRASPEELGSSRAEIETVFDERLNHRKKLGAYEGPVLILHAENDHLVGVEHARKNARWAGGPVEEVIFDRGDHNSIFALNREAYVDALVEFLSGPSAPGGSD